MNFFDQKIAQRLGGRAFGQGGDYKFARIKALKEQARVEHPELPLIDMGVGEPDTPADPGIVQVLREECGRLENRFYADNGILEFQQAAAAYMQQVFHVDKLDPQTQILHGIGTKPILAMLPLCLIDPGDISLVTTPGYPVLGTYTRYMGGEVYPLPLRLQQDFYPDFDAIPHEILQRAKLLYINYPNNPTGQIATLEFFERVVDFARRYDIAVIHDAAYAALTYDGRPPLSFLSVPGAMEVGAEIQSLSKAFNMTGWRLGFLAGNAKLIAAYAKVKDNTDSGQFRAIQKAGVYALAHPELTAAVCEKYSRRFDLLVPCLQKLGFSAKKPGGSFYCYVPAPKGAGDGVVFATAQEAAEYLIRQANISVVPWDECGAYLRFSVTFEAPDIEREQQLIRELYRRLSALELRF